MGDSLTVTDVLLLKVMAEATYFLTDRRKVDRRKTDGRKDRRGG